MDDAFGAAAFDVDALNAPTTAADATAAAAAAAGALPPSRGAYAAKIVLPAGPLALEAATLAPSYDDAKHAIDLLYARGQDALCVAACAAMLKQYGRHKSRVAEILDTAVRAATRGGDAGALARCLAYPEARAHSSYWDWQERLARQRGDLTGVARALQKSVSPLQSNPPAWHRLALATLATAEAEAQPVRRPFWTLAAVLAAQKAWSEVSVRARHTEPSSFAQTTYATELSAVAEARARILAFARSPPYHPVADDATTLAAQAAHLATELAARTASGDEELSTHDGLLKALHAFAAVCPPAWLSSPSLEPALPPETAEVASWWSDTALQMVEARRNDPTASLDAEAPAPALDSGSDGDASDGDGDGAGAASANSDGKARPSAQRRGASGGRRGGAFG